tara:strand:+ start:205 stop:597 length:393 start_codon:yes stop_codon:yes gene_type:complete
MISAMIVACSLLGGTEDPLLNDVERQIVEQTNLARRRHGLPTLRVCPKLQEQSRNHAGWMARSGKMQHGSHPGAAENIATGRTLPSVLRRWMNSKGHRSNILGSNYTRIGAAAYRNPTSGRIYWCQQFGR